MPITLNKDSINFGNYSISLHPNGIEIDGKFKYASNELLQSNHQGTASGYVSGTVLNNPGTIDRFSFTSDGNATAVGTLSQARVESAGQSSKISGYTSGGKNGPSPSASLVNTIDKFPFASNGTATDVGNIVIRRLVTGQSSLADGYISGGAQAPSASTNIIDKFPFAADANATDVGDLAQARYGSAGQGNFVNGYNSGGATGFGFSTNVIDKFPFASDSNATDVGDLTQGRYFVAGQSSAVNGYSSGGTPTTNSVVDTIDKFPFASDANATDVGNLGAAHTSGVGQSSTTHGYFSGGSGLGGAIIYKFPFAVDANSTGVGNLTTSRANGRVAGQQV